MTKNTIYNLIRQKCLYYKDISLICTREKKGYYVVLNKENEKLRVEIHDILSDYYKNKDVMCTIKKVRIDNKRKGILYKYELI